MVELTAEQRDIKMAAQEFAEKEFRDIARELEAKEEFDDRIWKKTAENGFLAVFVPEEYGGRDSAILNSALSSKSLPG